LDVQSKTRREHAEREKRLEDLAVRVLVAMRERDGAVADADRRAGQALEDVAKDGRIDLGCVLGSASFEVPLGDGADAAIVGEGNTALVSFTMTLLKRLQGLGSSPAIDYDAYAAWGRSRSTGDGNRANSR
jgi:hypothetical protein